MCAYMCAYILDKIGLNVIVTCLCVLFYFLCPFAVCRLYVQSRRSCTVKHPVYRYLIRARLAVYINASSHSPLRCVFELRLTGEETSEGDPNLLARNDSIRCSFVYLRLRALHLLATDPTVLDDAHLTYRFI